MRFFFYGTLMDRELLQRVLQRPVAARALMPARLAGWRRCAIRGHDFPAIVHCRRAVVEGVLLDHVSAADRDKLVAYEGEGYTIARAIAELPDGRRQPVLLFVPRPGFYTLSNAGWSPVRSETSRRQPLTPALSPQAGRGRAHHR